MAKQDDGILSLLLTVDVDEFAFKDAEKRLKDLLEKEKQFASALNLGGKIGAGAGALVDAGAVTAEILKGLKKASQAVIDRSAEAAPRWSYMAFGLSPAVTDALNSADHNKVLKSLGVTSASLKQWTSDLFVERANILDVGEMNDERVIRQSEIAQRSGVAANDAEYFDFYRNATAEQYMARALDMIQWAVETGNYNNVATVQQAFSLPDEIVGLAWYMEQSNRHLREDGGQSIPISAYLLTSDLDNVTPELRKAIEVRALEELVRAKSNAQREQATELNKDVAAKELATSAYALNTSLKSLEETATRLSRDILMLINGHALPAHVPLYLEGEGGKNAKMRLGALPSQLTANEMRAGQGWAYAKKSGQFVPVVDSLFYDDYENYQQALKSGLGEDNILDADMYQGDRMSVSKEVEEVISRLAPILGVNPDFKHASHKDRSVLADLVTDYTTEGGSVDAMRYSAPYHGAPSKDEAYRTTIRALWENGEVEKAQQAARLYAYDLVRALLRRGDNSLNLREGTEFEDVNIYPHLKFNGAKGRLDLDISLSYSNDDAQTKIASFEQRIGQDLQAGVSK